MHSCRSLTLGACLVMVRVKSIAEMGAYVSLLEYNNIEGAVLRAFGVHALTVYA